MKYLSTLLLSLATTLLLTRAQDNEDVSRRILLDTPGALEVHTDLRFKTGSDPKSYFFVVPRHLESLLVSLSAVVSTTQEEAQVKKVDRFTVVPAEVKKAISDKNATEEITLYQITTKADATNKGVLGLSVKEVYKRRKDPFPSTVKILEEQSIKFVDSKYYVSVYPTKNQKTVITFTTPNLL
jgi:flagellar biosynthesis component FlhA